jgi:UDP-N-acetylmuramoylalanine--D-glutamate ligase
LKLDEYVKAMRGLRIDVIGAGVSNTPLIYLLLERGCVVTVRDAREASRLGGEAERMERMGAKMILGPEYMRGIGADVIFRTPGLRPDAPELAAARAGGAVITSEMEAFFRVCPCMTVGVTGSDGKTTTTTVIAEILKRAGRRVHVGGNIGAPLLAEADSFLPDDIAVLELSSFQLMTMGRSPNIAVMTNLAPNHLDYHRDMDEYIDSKRNIYRRQSADGAAVFNGDDGAARAMASEAPGETRFFSSRESVENGVFLAGGRIMAARRGSAPEELIEVSDIAVPGAHNVYNFMAAAAATLDLADARALRETAEEFKGVEHRLEFVSELRGVRYYNDSIATSPTRTAAGLRSFDGKVILIAGGKDKGVPFDGLAPEIIRRVKTLVLTGLAAGKIRAAVMDCPDYAGRPEIITRPGFADAVRAAADAAAPGDAVLLSPACTSLDAFSNFEERGNFFKEIINGLD